jgi:hypothetical protein
MVPDRLHGRWHKHILAWMEANGYLAVNSEKTIFMKREGKHFIIYGLFVDDMMHIATNNKLKNEFMEKYSRDFNITGGSFMKTLQAWRLNRATGRSRCTLTINVREMLNEYKAYIKKSLRPKFPSHKESSFDQRIAPLSRIQTEPSQVFVAKLEFAASWIRFDI